MIFISLCYIKPQVKSLEKKVWIFMVPSDKSLFSAAAGHMTYGNWPFPGIIDLFDSSSVFLLVFLPDDKLFQ